MKKKDIKLIKGGAIACAALYAVSLALPAQAAPQGDHYKADAHQTPTTTVVSSKTGEKLSPNGLVIARAAYGAGFRGEGLVRAIAVSRAESSWRTNARLRNKPTKGCPNGSTDRGAWQINDCYHPEVSTACADDPNCAAKHVKRLSRNGGDFSAWVTANDAKDKPFMTEARKLAHAVSS